MYITHAVRLHTCDGSTSIASRRLLGAAYLGTDVVEMAPPVLGLAIYLEGSDRERARRGPRMRELGSRTHLALKHDTERNMHVIAMTLRRHMVRGMACAANRQPDLVSGEP